MNWLAKRVAVALITVYVAASLTFFIVRAMPGDPIEALAQEFVKQYYMSYAEALALARSVAPFVPKGDLLHQYLQYMWNFLHGNLGVSITYSTGTPVIKLLAATIPWTVLVVATSLVISFAIGIAIGMLMAYKHGSKLDSGLALLFSITRSLPEYLVAIFMLSIFAFQLSWFPTRGAYTVEPGPTLEFVADVMYHAALPIMTWIIVHFGGWALGMRGNTISVLGEDYIAYAKARGIPGRRIVFTYIGRNAILPLFTSLMISLGFMFGGSIFIEYIFSYPGVGYMLYQALINRDWYLMIGAFDIIVIAVVTGTLLADVLYGFLDPRVRRGER